MCGAIRVPVLALVTVLALAGCSRKDEAGAVPAQGSTETWPGFFVNGKWVATHWEQLTIVDARDAESYARGHVHGAIHLPVDEVCRPTAAGGAGLVPWARFEDVMVSRGIGENARVVVYGDAGDGKAACLVWALDAYGHDKVALLLDGMEGWKGAGYTVDKAPRKLPRQNYRARLRTDLIASRMGVMESIMRPDVGLLDVRPAPEETEINRGRIPSSLNVDLGKALMVPRGLEAAGRLQAALGGAANGKERVLIYGDEGPRAVYSYLALRNLGLNVALYPGGWAEWSANANLPVEYGGRMPVRHAPGASAGQQND